jgi:hypothetical protein
LLPIKEEQVLVEAEKSFQQHIKSAKKSKSLDTAAILQDLLQHIADNSNSMQVLLSENGDSNFQKKLFREGLEGLRSFIEAVGVTAHDKKMVNYGFVFLTGGILLIIQEWLKNGMDTPVPEMAKMLAKFTRQAMG